MMSAVCCLSRVLLASTALLFMPGTSAQSVFALLVVTVFAVLTLKLQPYINSDDDMAATTAGWSLWLALFYALLFRAKVISGAQTSFGILLVVAQVCLQDRDSDRDRDRD